MAKAIRMFGEIATVTPTTSLIRAEDADRIIASVDAGLQPCTPQQAAVLTAELIAAYPSLAMQRTDPSLSKDFQLYAVKLIEAFSKFSFEIGKLAVHGADGVPGRVQFKPQPSDVVAFATRELERRQNVKTMAMRHKAEAERREKLKAEEDDYVRNRPAYEERKRQVEKLLGSFRENAR
jgi:hypothetical protein